MESGASANAAATAVRKANLMRKFPDSCGWEGDGGRGTGDGGINTKRDGLSALSVTQMRDLVPWARPSQRCKNRRAEDSPDHAERSDDWNVNKWLDQHLGADENQDDREAELEVDELVNYAGEQKIERPQAQYCADVRCVNDKRVARDRENCGDRVRGENDVRRVDDQ